MERTSADFCIEIDYEKSSPNPSRVFRAMSGLIDACQHLDECLLSSIDSKIEPVILLEDIESGSIRSWLRHLVQAKNDEHLKARWKEIITAYLPKATYFVIDFLHSRTTITLKDVEELEDGLRQLGEGLDIKHLPFYQPPSRLALLESINKTMKDLFHYRRVRIERVIPPKR